MIEPKFLEDIVNIGYAVPKTTSIALKIAIPAALLSLLYVFRDYYKSVEYEEKKKRSSTKNIPLSQLYPQPIPTNNPILTDRRLGKNRRVRLGYYEDREENGGEIRRKYGNRLNDYIDYMNLCFNITPKLATAGWR